MAIFQKIRSGFSIRGRDLKVKCRDQSDQKYFFSFLYMTQIPPNNIFLSGTHQFDLFCTSTIFIYATFFVLYSLPVHYSLVLYSLYFGCTFSEKGDDMKMVEVQKRSNWCVPFLSEQILQKTESKVGSEFVHPIVPCSAGNCTFFRLFRIQVGDYLRAPAAGIV